MDEPPSNEIHSLLERMVQIGWVTRFARDSENNLAVHFAPLGSASMKILISMQKELGAESGGKARWEALGLLAYLELC